MKLITNESKNLSSFLSLKNLEIDGKNIKRLKYQTGIKKNLFNINNYSKIATKIGFDISGLEIGKTYTISCNQSNFRWIKISNSPDGHNSVATHTIPYNKSSFTFVMSRNSNIPETATQYIFLQMMNSTSSGFAESISELGVNQIQIEEGSSATYYVDYNGCVDLGVIPSGGGYILDSYNNISEELLSDTVEKDNVEYYIPDKTNILLNKIEGKTNKIVQLLDKSTVNCSSVNDWIGGTGSDTNLRVANGVVSIDGTLGSYSGVRTQDNKPIIKGHKYYISTWAMCSKNASNVLLPYTYGFSSSTSTLTANEWKNAEKIDTANVSDTTSIGVRYGSGESSEETVVWSVKKPQFFDLTAMYGFGNEPTTVEQFKKDYPQFFDEKLDGIWNVKTSGISTTGENIYGLEDFIKKNNASDMIITYDGKKCFKISRAFNPTYYFPLGNYSLNFKAYSTYERSFCSFGKYENGTHTIKYYVGGSTSGTWENDHYNLTDCNFIQWYNEVPSDKVLYVDIASFSLSAGIDDTNSYIYTENKIDLLSIQTLNGINGVNDYIEVIDKGNGLYDLKKTQNIDSVDLGTLDWAADGANFYSSSISSVIKPPTNDNSVGNYTCQKYVNVALSKSFVDGDFGVNSSGRIYFRNSAYTTAAAFKTAMNGVILYYQLKTPVITTIATNLTYNQVSAIRTNGGLLLVNDNNNQKYVQPDVTLKENFQYKS